MPRESATVVGDRSGKPSAIDTLPEYAANPLIAALSPIPSTADIIGTLERRPYFSEHERQLPGHLRRHCVLRLVEWFEPLQHHVFFAERIDMMIRTGYRGRNPLERAFAADLAQRAEAIQMRRAAPSRPLASTARAMALLGASGMGKSVTKDNVFGGYDQVIYHTGADGGPTLTQIVWLQVECPSGGSLKSLCLNILSEIDRVLGTSYRPRAKRADLDELQLLLAQKLQLHAVGILAIDEINYLSSARTEKERVINFLTSLVNTVNVPLLMIGTMEGIGVLTDTFRNGRRGTGLGSVLFERLERDETWTFFLESMFQFQWTKDEVPLDDELSKTLWNESQGIIDIVVKIFMLSQLRLIAIGEASGRPERITCDLFRKIAKTELGLTRPMLDALRSGNPKEMARYGDLRSLQSTFQARLRQLGERSVQDRICGDRILRQPRVSRVLHQPRFLRLLEKRSPPWGLRKIRPRQSWRASIRPCPQATRSPPSTLLWKPSARGRQPMGGVARPQNRSLKIPLMHALALI